VAKYSFEFKKKVVLSYFIVEDGYTYLAKIYGTPSRSKIGQWVANYKKIGDEGLSVRKKKYNIFFSV